MHVERRLLNFLRSRGWMLMLLMMMMMLMRRVIV